MKKKMVGDVPGNVLGMMADLCHKLQHGTIKPEELGLFLKGKIRYDVMKDVSDQIFDWQEFYRDLFQIEEIDLFGVKVPERKPGFERLIVVLKGLTPNKVFEVCQENFPCWRYTDDLDEAVRGRNDREPTETYAIRVRDRQEADEELKDLSTDQLKEKGTQGITLLERLLYELKYWSETQKHLDINNWTLCAGSRGAYGRIPRVHWYGLRLGVAGCPPDHHDGLLRARAAVS